MLKKEKADALHKTEKIITVALQWRSEPGNRYRIEATVLAPIENEILKLCGNIGKENYSFSLLYRNYVVRKYTKHRAHTCPITGEKITVPHKHLWDKDYEDRKVFIPPDLDPSADINDQFLAFLKEENITFQNGYQRIMHRV